MNRDHYIYVLWTLALLGGAVALIMFQHATHTNAILSMLPSGVGASSIDPAAIVPGNAALARPSLITGNRTPLGGPAEGLSPFPYAPAQNQATEDWEYAPPPIRSTPLYMNGAVYEVDIAADGGANANLTG